METAFFNKNSRLNPQMLQLLDRPNGEPNLSCFRIENISKYFNTPGVVIMATSTDSDSKYLGKDRCLGMAKELNFL